MPFDALFVPQELRDAVSDRAWVRAMVEAERALLRVQFGEQLPHELELDPDELIREGIPAGNPVVPLVRRLRELNEHVHHGATSQDVLDTATALVARHARGLILRDLDGAAEACARLAEEHRDTLTAARTLLQQALPTTFGLKAATWLAGLGDARALLAGADVPVQLGGAAGTLAAFGEGGLKLREELARDLGLSEPLVSWHTLRLPIADLGTRLAIAAGVCEKVALDVELLAQTEVAEVREPHEGGSSTLPQKRNPIGSTLVRACAMRARASAGVLVEALAQEHERAAGAWHAEWPALTETLACTGGAASWLRRTLAGLEVDAGRMRANLRDETMAEAERFAPGTERPEDYLGAAGALVDAVLARHRERR